MQRLKPDMACAATSRAACITHCITIEKGGEGEGI